MSEKLIDAVRADGYKTVVGRSTAEGTPSNSGTLLVEAPVGHHFAQLHREDDALADSVATFLEAGLRQGAGVIVVATDAHTELFVDRLGRAGLKAERYRSSGQLTLVDADELLRGIMRSGMPDWVELQRAVVPALERVHSFSRSPCRAYGEMVSLLWNQAQQEAAIRLEEYWNELGRLHPFSLFCGYLIDTYEEAAYSTPLHEIGRTHSNVLATAEDEVFRRALDAASRDIFGVSLPDLISYSERENGAGHHRLPVAQRTMYWIVKNMPTSKAVLLERARNYYRLHHLAVGTKPN